MAIRIVETWNSRELGLELGDADAMAEYAITGTTNELDAYAACLAEVPSNFHDLSFKSLKIRPLTGPNWIADVRYGISTTGLAVPGQSGVSPPPPPPPPPAETDALTDEDGVSFSTVGGTVRVNTSIKTVSKINLGGVGDVPPDYERQIGAKGEGCEIFNGRLQFTLKRNLPSVSMKYIKKLSELTGSVNLGTWKGWFGDSAALFLGAEGEYAGPKGWAVTYQFDITSSSPILNNLGVEVGTLPPHHYAWFLTRRKESGTPAAPVDVPIALYIEQVYPKADLDALGI